MKLDNVNTPRWGWADFQLAVMVMAMQFSLLGKIASYGHMKRNLILPPCTFSRVPYDFLKKILCLLLK
jgi:hypothetical protein